MSIIQGIADLFSICFHDVVTLDILWLPIGCLAFTAVATTFLRIIRH